MLFGDAKSSQLKLVIISKNKNDKCTTVPRPAVRETRAYISRDPRPTALHV